MRRTGWIGLPLCAWAMGCAAIAGDPNVQAPAPDAGAIPPPIAANDSGAPTADGVERDASAVTDMPLTLSGRIENSLGGCPAQRITIVDANGTVSMAVTDATGAFTVDQVLPPYSLTADNGSIPRSPLAFLGLRSVQPRVFEADGKGGRAAWVSTSLGLPACLGGTCVVCASFSGSQHACTPLDEPAGTSAPLTTSTSWNGGLMTTQTMSVLVSDKSYTMFWYATSNVALTDGATTNVPLMTPSAVPTAAMFTAQTASVPSNWYPNTSFTLEYPDHGGIAQLAYASSSILTTGAPNILGATVSIQASAQSNVLPWTVAVAWSRGLPLMTASAALTLGPSASWIAPQGGGTIHSDAVLLWERSAPDAVEVLSVTNLTTQATSNIVMMGSNALSLRTLAQAGVALDPGMYQVALTQAGPAANIDAMMDERVLRGLYGGLIANATTTLTTFTVAP